MSVPQMKIDSKGTKFWYLNGERHRTDGPAVEYSDGTKQWWLNGELHRTDGPAVERPDGSKYWRLNGKYHRTDGPAIERSDGTNYWYLNGNEVTWFEVYLHNLRTGDNQTAKRILESEVATRL
jgi:hypothetical protein